jgi:hypothetical protein
MELVVLQNNPEKNSHISDGNIFKQSVGGHDFRKF